MEGEGGGRHLLGWDSADESQKQTPLQSAETQSMFYLGKKPGSWMDWLMRATSRQGITRQE